MTPQEWEQFAGRLSYPGGSFRLLADGTRLTIQVERWSKTALSYKLLVYINGKIEWGQMFKPNELAAKFWKKRQRRMHSPQKKASIIKGVNKRMQKYITEELKLDATMDFYEPHFPTSAALKKHLLATCQQIEVYRDPDEGSPQ